MKRRIVMQGGQAMTITLPVAWTRRFSLKAGDEIDIEEAEDQLIITHSAPGAVKRKEVSIDEHHHGRTRTVLASLYKAGYDEIVFNFKVPPKMHEMSKLVETFTGLEVVGQQGNSVTIKSFVSGGKDGINNLIVKMFQMAGLMADSIANEWKKVDLRQLDSISVSTRKLRDHVIRLICKNRYGDEKTYDYYDLATQIEKLTFDLLIIGRYASSAKTTGSSLFKDVALRLNEFYRCYLKMEFSMASSLWKKQTRNTDEIMEPAIIVSLLKKEDPPMVVYYHSVMHRFVQIASRIMAVCS